MADKREPKLDISLYGTRQCPAEVELVTSTRRGVDEAQKSLVLGEAERCLHCVMCSGPGTLMMNIAFIANFWNFKTTENRTNEDPR